MKPLICWVASTLVAASTLVSQTGPLFLATEAYSGVVQLVDAAGHTVVEVADTTQSGFSYTPNGSAFDVNTGRFYFTETGTGNSDLYYIDEPGGAPVMAGDLGGRAPNGTFYNGYYYYVDSGTDDLRRVELDANGFVVSEVIEVQLGNSSGFGFGDIAIRSDGLLVLHGGVGGNPVMLQYDLVAGTQISSLPVTVTMQVAFASDGVLYACDTSHQLHTIDLLTGVSTAIGTLPLTNHLTDLAVFSADAWPTTSASCIQRTGTGSNPVACTCGSLPILGASWDIDIALDANTILTLALASFAAIQPTPLPFGELLIAPPVVDVPGNGTHTAVLPNDLQFLGAELFVQGLRIKIIGPDLVLELTDAQDAVVGF